MKKSEFVRGPRNWLLHARYVRGEHDLCVALADKLQKDTNNTHRYAYFIKALILADASRLQDALDKFHTCIKLQPQDPKPLKQVAKCLFHQGRYQLSLEAYLEADKLSKYPDPEIYSALAECAKSLGDVEHGVEWARSAVQAGGGERAGALLAKLLLEAGNLDAALTTYEDALASHACGADTLAAAGALQLRAGDPRRAFQLLGEALSQQPTQHAAALALAAMMLQHKDVDAALARLKAALTAHPCCVAAHANLGLALLSKKKYVAALTCLQRAVWAAPLSAGAAHDLGFVLLICKRPASALYRLAAAAALQPTHPYTVLLIAIALERLEDSRTDSAYSRAVELNPEDALIRLNLAARHARANRLSDAINEAVITAKLLHRENNIHLASSLALLMTLLREAGANSSELIDCAPISSSSQTGVTELNSPEVDNFEADGTENQTIEQRDASLIILPPIIIGYDELYNDAQTSEEKLLTQNDDDNTNINHPENHKINKEDKIKRIDERSSNPSQKLYQYERCREKRNNKIPQNLRCPYKYGGI